MSSPTLTQAEYRRLKTRLTRALNAHKRDQTMASANKLKNEAADALDYFEDHGYPDEWHRWKNAREDAIYWMLRHR